MAFHVARQNWGSSERRRGEAVEIDEAARRIAESLTQLLRAVHEHHSAGDREYDERHLAEALTDFGEAIVRERRATSEQAP